MQSWMMTTGRVLRSRQTLRDMAKAALIAVPIAATMFALFCLANLHGLRRDLPAARAHIAAAFADGSLQDQDWLPGNTGIGHHQFNDCLILQQAIDQAATDRQLAVSPIKPLLRPGLSLCASLRAFVAGVPPPGEPAFYHQYIHGHTMLVRYLLPVMPVDAIRTLYKCLAMLLVGAGVLVATMMLARSRTALQRTMPGLFWLILFLALGRWFGLESFGQSLSHGPADLVILVYLLAHAVAAMRGGISPRTAIVATALFGALSAIFDFLTGGIPLGLAMVIGALPFACIAADAEAQGRLAIGAVVAFCTAYITALLLKILLALAIFGYASMVESAFRLSIRLGLNGAAGEIHDLGPVHMAKSLLKGLGSLAAGMPLLVALMLAIAIGAGLWGYRQLMRSTDPMVRMRAGLLLASNIAIVAILTGFWQHTIVHAWFMDRVFVWTIASGFALFAMAIVEDRRHQA
jgi:hypothetical protein